MCWRRELTCKQIEPATTDAEFPARQRINVSQRDRRKINLNERIDHRRIRVCSQKTKANTFSPPQACQIPSVHLAWANGTGSEYMKGALAKAK